MNEVDVTHTPKEPIQTTPSKNLGITPGTVRERKKNFLGSGGDIPETFHSPTLTRKNSCEIKADVPFSPHQSYQDNDLSNQIKTVCNMNENCNSKALFQTPTKPSSRYNELTPSNNIVFANLVSEGQFISSPGSSLASSFHGQTERHDAVGSPESSFYDSLPMTEEDFISSPASPFYDEESQAITNDAFSLSVTLFPDDLSESNSNCQSKISDNSVGPTTLVILNFDSNRQSLIKSITAGDFVVNSEIPENTIKLLQASSSAQQSSNTDSVQFLRDLESLALAFPLFYQSLDNVGLTKFLPSFLSNNLSYISYFIFSTKSEDSIQTSYHVTLPDSFGNFTLYLRLTGAQILSSIGHLTLSIAEAIYDNSWTPVARSLSIATCIASKEHFIQLFKENFIKLFSKEEYFKYEDQLFLYANFAFNLIPSFITKESWLEIFSGAAINTIISFNNEKNFIYYVSYIANIVTALFNIQSSDRALPKISHLIIFSTLITKELHKLPELPSYTLNSIKDILDSLTTQEKPLLQREIDDIRYFWINSTPYNADNPLTVRIIAEGEYYYSNEYNRLNIGDNMAINRDNKIHSIKNTISRDFFIKTLNIAAIEVGILHYDERNPFYWPMILLAVTSLPYNMLYSNSLHTKSKSLISLISLFPFIQSLWIIQKKLLPIIYDLSPIKEKPPLQETIDNSENDTSNLKLHDINQTDNMSLSFGMCSAFKNDSRAVSKQLFIYNDLNGHPLADNHLHQNSSSNSEKDDIKYSHHSTRSLSIDEILIEKYYNDHTSLTREYKIYYSILSIIVAQGGEKIAKMMLGKRYQDENQDQDKDKNQKKYLDIIEQAIANLNEQKQFKSDYTTALDLVFYGLHSAFIALSYPPYDTDDIHSRYAGADKNDKALSYDNLEFQHYANLTFDFIHTMTYIAEKCQESTSCDLGTIVLNAPEELKGSPLHKYFKSHSEDIYHWFEDSEII